MDSRAVEQALRSGLIEVGRPLLVMLSGGADSVCLLDVALRLGAKVGALHVNYGLRTEADADEAHCRRLCERLGVALTIEHVLLTPGPEGSSRGPAPGSEHSKGQAELGPGNLQARARDARYSAAERHASGDYAAAHTASDQAETVLYRLVTSPGRSALLGMQARRGRLVRPLLEASREDTREHCRLAGLGWREDRSNVDPRFARSRIRHEVLPVLSQLAPQAERTIALTARRLREETEVLDGAADRAVRKLGEAPAVDELRALPRPLTQLVLRRLAPGASLSADDVDVVLGLTRRGGSASLDIGGGWRAVVEYGRLRFTRARASPPPAAARLAIPGSVRFGGWLIEASLGAVGEVVLAAAAVGEEAVVRSWRPGDRMRPAGLGGSKKLQDLFTDRKVPRESRASVPVVEVSGEIAWVVGVALDERFRAEPDGERVAFSAFMVDRHERGQRSAAAPIERAP